uniref:Uncharacterized protein n=1 Tax=Anguilla anguilla TaxID=7936 RepID=A0A0E9WAB9_ANGAN
MKVESITEHAFISISILANPSFTSVYGLELSVCQIYFGAL